MVIKGTESVCSFIYLQYVHIMMLYPYVSDLSDLPDLPDLSDLSDLSNRSDLIYSSIYSWWTMEDSWDTRVYNTVLIMGYTIWQSHLAGWKL